MNRVYSLADSLFWFGISLATLAVCYGGLHFIDTSLVAFFPSTKTGLLAGLVLAAAGAALARRCSHRLRFSPAAVLGAASLVMLSDLPQRRYALFELPRGAQLGLLLVFTAFGYFAGRRRALYPLLLTAAVVLPAAAFLASSHGQLLFADDHPAFFYRLTQLKERFPFIPFYNPLWNAGVDAREFFPSGVLAPFLLAAPLVYFLPLESVYNQILVYLFLLLLPASVYLAARLLGSSGRSACVAAILALSSSLMWYRWLFVYGAIGFLTSVTLLPLVLALGARITSGESSSPRQVWFFAAVLAVMLLWPLAVLMLAPLWLLMLFKSRMLMRQRHAVFAGLVLAAVSLPWMVVFAKASRVGSFVQIEQNAGTAPQLRQLPAKEQSAPAPGQRLLNFAGFREAAQGANPLLLLFLLPGLAFLPTRTSRLLFGGSAAWFIILGCVGAGLKPQLELERMFVPALVMATLPTAAALESITGGAASSRLSRALLCGMLCLTVAAVWCLTANRGKLRLVFAKPIVAELTKAIEEQGGAGRTLFAGFILHELNEGHVAPLAYFTQRPLMASHYQHSYWRYHDVIPESFRKEEEQGVLDFLNLYNVSVIVTSDKFWRRWYERRPQWFEKRWHSNRFTLFARVGYGSSYFLEGSGEIVEQTGDRVVFIPGAATVVLKFHYFPFVKSSACEVTEFRAAESLQPFIKLEGCPVGEKVTVTSKSFFSRLLH